MKNEKQDNKRKEEEKTAEEIFKTVRLNAG